MIRKCVPSSLWSMRCAGLGTDATRLAFACAMVGSTALADPAVIEDVMAEPGPDGWRFSVTLSHGDMGWDDYADGWRVELDDGTIAGERPLAHPHVNEQPFTRSTSGVAIPDGVTAVQIRARTNVDGWDSETTAFTLPGAD